MSLGQRTAKGIFWAYATYFGGRILTLISTAILARLLIPEDFGLIGFSLVLMAFIEVSRGFGINEALIYISDEVDEAANTAFWLNVGIGFLQTIFLVLLAPLATTFFDDPRIIDVVRVMALTFIFNGLGQTHDALLQKELEFQRRFIPDLLSNIIKGVTSIVLALMGLGLWSLVIGHLVGAAARTVSKWYVLRWFPKWAFSLKRARELWDYGFYILAFEMLNIALEQADQALIGSLLGAVQLGYYTVAAKIPEMVIANFSIVLTRVIFPTFAKMKDDLEQLTAGFLRTTQYTAFVTIPAGIGMASVARELVLVFFGDQWEPAILLLQVLALLGMMATLPWSAGDVLKALGRPDISTKMLLFEACYTFPLIVILVSQYRVAVMASFANLISLTITAFFRLGVISYYLKLDPRVFVKIFRSPFLSALVMSMVITLWRTVAQDLPMVLILLVSILLGALVYSVMMWFLERDTLDEGREMLLGMFSENKEQAVTS